MQNSTATAHSSAPRVTTKVIESYGCYTEVFLHLDESLTREILHAAMRGAFGKLGYMLWDHGFPLDEEHEAVLTESGWVSLEGGPRQQYNNLGIVLGDDQGRVGLCCYIYARGEPSDELDHLDYTKETCELGLDDIMLAAQMFRDVMKEVR